MISIIIPTLNEEKHLPKLLDCIKRQTYKDYEIIVADAGSKDKTVQVAKKYGAKVVKGGMPSVGRNKGAKAAQGEYLLFLDADVCFTRTFLKELLQAFEKKYLEVATCEFDPLSKKEIDKLMHKLGNVYMKATEKFYPHGPGFCIMATHRIHKRINGWNEDIKLAEDHDYLIRAARFGRFAVLKKPRIKVSVRRLDKEGRINLIKKYFKVEARRLVRGEITDDSIGYEFGAFDDTKEEKILDEIEKQLKQLRKTYQKLNDAIKRRKRI